jgi:hypothetical protein
VPSSLQSGPVQEGLGDCLAAIEAAKQVGHQRAELNGRSVYVAFALEMGEWSEVRDHYTRSEPFVWADFFIARGRALATFGRGDRDPVLMTELRRLRDEGERLGLKPAMPSLEAALAAALT